MTISIYMIEITNFYHILAVNKIQDSFLAVLYYFNNFIYNFTRNDMLIIFIKIILNELKILFN
jgi:hypothetical protein